MQLLAEILRRLHRLPSTWPGLPGRVQMERAEALDRLEAVARELGQGRVRASRPLPPEKEQKRVLALWHQSNGSLKGLSSRDIRLLCQHPAVAMDPAFLEALQGHPQLSKRRLWAEGLLGHYFLQWREMAQAERVEEQLKRVLGAYSPSAAWLAPLRPGPWEVLGPRAPKALIRRLENPVSQLRPFLASWGLVPEHGLGRAVVEEGLQVATEAFRAARPESSEPETRARLGGLLTELFPLLPKGKVFDQSLERLILSEGAKRSHNIREDLLAWCLAHPELGDPRRQPGWHPIPLARQSVVSWMAQRDLTFFYDSIVSNYEDDQGRKAFWLQYINVVQDFRLVLSENDRSKLDLRFRAKGTISNMGGNTDVSAFLLRFKDAEDRDFICVEFSKTGNALYIYEAETFEDQIAPMHAHTFRIQSGATRNLKDSNLASARKTHQGYWQYDVAQYLASRGVTVR